MPVVINEIVIQSPPPDAEPPALEVKLPDAIISSYQTSGHDAGAAPASGESFSWFIAHEGASFDGRLLTADDLRRDQDSGGTRSSGETTLGDVVVVKQIDKAGEPAAFGQGTDLLLGGAGDDADGGDVDLNDFSAMQDNFGTGGMADGPGGALLGFGDGSVRFVSAGVDGGVW
jgi:hypothetical protein